MSLQNTHPRSTLIKSSVFCTALLLAACGDSPAPQTDGAELNTESAEPTVSHEHQEHSESAAGIPRSSAPEDARVFFVSPHDGATVTSPVQFEFALEGMEVVPAGEQQDNAGHHHLLINLDELPAMDFPLPASDQVIHFGAGQTEAELELAPGQYRFQLLLGDHFHIPHQPPVLSEVIEVTVE